MTCVLKKDVDQSTILEISFCSPCKIVLSIYLKDNLELSHVYNKLPAGFWFSIAGTMKSWSEE